MHIIYDCSPWQLLSPIQTFLDEHYPLGELVLNRLNFKDTSFLRFMATGKYKVEAFRERHLLFPAKKWYLIGDAGHTDPETFAEIYKRWGSDVIACIWIKTVHGTNTAKELQRNAMSRFNKTFAEVPRERWNIFSNPASIQELPAGKCV